MAVATHPKGPVINHLSASPLKYPEAPDSGIWRLDPEAPETREGRTAEAPDAGEGRMDLLEHEFTHGRSQS